MMQINLKFLIEEYNRRTGFKQKQREINTNFLPLNDNHLARIKFYLEHDYLSENLTKPYKLNSQNFSVAVDYTKFREEGIHEWLLVLFDKNRNLTDSQVFNRVSLYYRSTTYKVVNNFRRFVVLFDLFNSYSLKKLNYYNNNELILDTFYKDFDLFKDIVNDERLYSLHDGESKSYMINIDRPRFFYDPEMNEFRLYQKPATSEGTVDEEQQTQTDVAQQDNEDFVQFSNEELILVCMTILKKYEEYNEDYIRSMLSHGHIEDTRLYLEKYRLDTIMNTVNGLAELFDIPAKSISDLADDTIVGLKKLEMNIISNGRIKSYTDLIIHGKDSIYFTD
jgi:hypothetical protein